MAKLEGPYLPRESQAALQPNTDAAIEFLRTWPSAFPHLVAIRVDPITREKGLVEGKAFPQPVDWDAVRKWIDERQGKSNLYFTVNSLLTPLDKKAKKTDVAEVVALHVDIDVPAGADQESTASKLADRVLKHKPTPSEVVLSGGGAQAFWVLEPSDRMRVDGDEAKAENAERFTRGIENEFSEARGAKADKCHNVDRVMRIPGSINLPDAKKLEKGRKAALAKLYASTGEQHPLSAFSPAGPKDTGTGSSVVTKTVDRLKIKVNWDTAAKLFNTISLADMRQRGVEEHALMSLEHGTSLQALHEQHTRIGHRVAEGPYPSFSEISLAVATALLRAEYSYEECAGVMCDPQYPGNRHQTEEKNRNKLRREVERTLGKAAADIEPGPEDLSKPPVLSEIDWAKNREVFYARVAPNLIFWNGSFYDYAEEDGCYHDLETKAVHAMANPFLHSAVVFRKDKKTGEKTSSKFLPQTSDFNELVNELMRAGYQHRDSMAPPCWINGASGPPPRECIKLLNGILHAPTRELSDATPDFFSLNALAFGYDPRATCQLWLKTVREWFPPSEDGTPSAEERLLQEIFGYMITSWTSLQKLFFFLGPGRSGKGTILRVLMMLLGHRNIAAPNVKGLVDTFGMATLIGKLAAIMGEVTITEKNRAEFTDMLKTISGEDEVTANRKNKDEWVGRLLCRFVLNCNKMPRFSDDSDAFVNRLVVLRFTRSFACTPNPLPTE